MNADIQESKSDLIDPKEGGHTLLPWQITNVQVAGKYYLTVSPWRSGIPCIAIVEGISPETDKSNAEFIVRAVNNFGRALRYLEIEHRKETERPYHTPDCSLCAFIDKGGSE